MPPKGGHLTEAERQHLRGQRLGVPLSAKHLEGVRLAWQNPIIREKRCLAIREGVKKNIWKRTGPNNHAHGKKFSAEHRQRLCLARAGRITTEETRRKCSESHRGEKSSAWKGGINKANDTIRGGIDFRLWREAVFARENWTCRKCGERGGNIHAHHLQNFAEYPELRFAIDNGAVLCKACHMGFHDKYGRLRNTEAQLNEYLQQEVLQWREGQG